MLYFTRSQRRFIEQYRPKHSGRFDYLVKIICDAIRNGKSIKNNIGVTVFAALIAESGEVSMERAVRNVQNFFNPDQEEPEPVPTADIAAQKLAHLKGYITQYEEGLITLHEMASSAVEKGFQIAEECQDQGCDGLPPNDILPV